MSRAHLPLSHDSFRRVEGGMRKLTPIPNSCRLDERGLSHGEELGDLEYQLRDETEQHAREIDSLKKKYELEMNALRSQLQAATVRSYSPPFTRCSFTDSRFLRLPSQTRKHRRTVQLLSTRNLLPHLQSVKRNLLDSPK